MIQVAAPVLFGPAPHGSVRLFFSTPLTYTCRPATPHAGLAPVHGSRCVFGKPDENCIAAVVVLPPLTLNEKETPAQEYATVPVLPSRSVRPCQRTESCVAGTSRTPFALDGAGGGQDGGRGGHPGQPPMQPPGQQHASPGGGSSQQGRQVPSSEWFLATNAAACGVKVQLADEAGAAELAYSASADSSITRRDARVYDASLLAACYWEALAWRLMRQINGRRC